MLDTLSPACDSVSRALPRDSSPPKFASTSLRALGFNPDGPLICAVEESLRSSGYPALRQVEIEICAGVVVLWGSVPSYHQKQLAQSLAQRVPGVNSIANGLEVICCR